MRFISNAYHYNPEKQHHLYACNVLNSLCVPQNTLLECLDAKTDLKIRVLFLVRAGVSLPLGRTHNTKVPVTLQGKVRES